MSTSGTYTWTMNLQSLVNAALRKLAVLSGGSSPESFEVTNATEALNALIAGFQADGLPIWKLDTLYFDTEAGNPLYTIGQGLSGPGTVDNVVPLKIIQAWRNQGTVKNVPLNIYTMYNYNLLPQSAAHGTPVTLAYQPEASVGYVALWPAPQDTSYQILCKYQKPFTDMLNLWDEVDFPRYWYEAVIYGLASRLSREYGIPVQDRQELKQEAEMFHQQALSFGTEEGSLYLQPDTNGKW